MIDRYSYIESYQLEIKKHFTLTKWFYDIRISHVTIWAAALEGARLLKCALGQLLPLCNIMITNGQPVIMIHGFIAHASILCTNVFNLRDFAESRQ